MNQISYEAMTQTLTGVLPISAGVACHPNPAHPAGKSSEQAAAPSPCEAGHEWVVFSTALKDVCLRLQCVNCGTMGTVDAPTEGEWSEAFHAPSRPYRWTDDARVRTRDAGAPHVVRTPGGCGCECHAQLGRIVPGRYERFPAEILGPLDGLTDESRAELREVAEMVAESDLCSLLFPHFIRSFEEASGHRHSDALHEINRRIERIDSKGLHFSPGVVAKVLRELAGRDL